MSSPSIFSCTACGQPVVFTQPNTTLIVCGNCHMRMTRDAGNGVLQENNIGYLKAPAKTAVETGMSGTWQGGSFSITGRLQVITRERTENWWTLCFTDGTMACLVDTHGIYSICKPVTFPGKVNFAAFINPVPGESVLDAGEGASFTFSRRDEVLQMLAEGENAFFTGNKPFKILEGRCKERFAAFTSSGMHGVYQAFEKFPVQLTEMGLQPTTPPAGHEPPMEAECRTCRHNNTLYTGQHATSFICAKCGRKNVQQQGKWVATGHHPLNEDPAIPLHTVLRLDGADYRVTGFLIKKDEFHFAWREYQLYHPVAGYAFLSEYNGHWIFLKENPFLNYELTPDGKRLLTPDDGFQQFTTYKARVHEAAGEFSKDVFEAGQPKINEYISPPRMVGIETDADAGQQMVVEGRHLSERELNRATDTPLRLPPRLGVGMVQPVWGSMPPMAFLKLMLIAILALLIAFLVGSKLNNETTVFSETLPVTVTPLITVPADSSHAAAVIPAPAGTSTNKPFTTPTFTLTKWRSNLKIDIHAGVDNSWFELEITLVNTATGKEYTYEKGVEYYYGYSGGENWKEGSTRSTLYISSLPAGTYYMELQYAVQPGIFLDRYSVTVSNDVPMIHNFWMFLLLLGVPSVSFGIYLYVKDKTRWENSPFSVYNNSAND